MLLGDAHEGTLSLSTTHAAVAAAASFEYDGLVLSAAGRGTV
jgi:hypothetical protein